MKKRIDKLSTDIEKLKDSRGYIHAGAPKFRGLFGRDSLIVAWQLLKYDPSIAEKTLTFLASLQGAKKDLSTGEEPGKILHEYYPEDTPDLWWKKHKESISWLKRGRPVYMSIDSTPLFLIVLGLYSDSVKNNSIVKSLKENIERAVNWMIDYGDKDKDLFLEYQKENPEGLFHQAWKDSDMKDLNITPPVSMVEVQGYQYMSLVQAAEMMKKINQEKLSEKYLERAKKLKKTFNEIFWSHKNQYFILALNKNKQKIDKITSNPGHLLFTGILSDERKKKTINRLFQKDMMTHYGIRTYSSKEKEFNYLSYHMGSIWPHDNWIIAQGLKNCKDKYILIKNSLLKAEEKLGFIPELYGVNNKGSLVEYEGACNLQAWASGSLLSFMIDDL